MCSSLGFYTKLIRMSMKMSTPVSLYLCPYSEIYNSQLRDYVPAPLFQFPNSYRISTADSRFRELVYLWKVTVQCFMNYADRPIIFIPVNDLSNKIPDLPCVIPDPIPQYTRRALTVCQIKDLPNGFSCRSSRRRNWFGLSKRCLLFRKQCIELSEQLQAYGSTIRIQECAQSSRVQPTAPSLPTIQ